MRERNRPPTHSGWVSTAFLLLVLAAAHTPAAAQEKVVIHSHALSPEIPTFSGGVGFSSRPLATFEKATYAANEVTLLEHLGTHVDAPYHFGGEGKRTIDQISPGELLMPAVIVDVREPCRKDPDYRLSIDDLTGWETTHGKIPGRAIVVMFTGWQAKWPDPSAYRNEVDGTMNFPGFGEAAARWLLEERDLLALGIDTLSADHGPSTDFPVHRVINGADRYIVENLTNLDRIPPRGSTFVVAPIPIAGGTGAPAMILSMQQ